MADLADGISLRHFQSRDFSVATKADGSAVTEVDMEIEAELSSWVARQRPTDGFLGEEVGAAGGHQQRWIVDGIDGTASFVAGATTWGTLIALEEQGEVVVGVASSPGFGRRWWAARGEGSWVVDLDPDAGPARRLRRALSPSGLGTSTPTWCRRSRSFPAGNSRWPAGSGRTRSRPGPTATDLWPSPTAAWTCPCTCGVGRGITPLSFPSWKRLGEPSAICGAAVDWIPSPPYSAALPV